ncbi:hypothetical protein AQ505_17400 [Pedobacter sp. PACM 27299]|uniref:UPF0758 domain-containing protein n=1 Tax=Pedobacter sp. PACM 27299 TaxID=1727164 RepID=UPI000706A633|nr:UPF0758 domain-containing protein [Pedobacter sp. PACM 27299]ALL07104.1 hypothetical protein AQ505_17400 [Pedobacter sp. PACM 27299]
MKNKTIVSESFSNSNKHYFLDFKVADNHTNYIQITRSDQMQDGSYTRNQVIVFEEDFYFLIQAFSSLFQSAAHHDQQNVTIKDLFHEKKRGQANGIKSWDPELRPRDKLFNNGVSVMDDAELLAILIHSGTPSESAVDLSSRILESIDDQISKLAELSHRDLCCFNGMGLAKSCSIMAAMELGKRAFAK